MVDVERGVYPFRNCKLERDDVEWLLATHRNGEGPVYWNRDDHQSSMGLDLRGAILQCVDLSDLPLARMVGGLTVEERQRIRDAHRGEDGVEELVNSCSDMAAVHLEGANLTRAHLEQAVLRRAHLECANLTGALMAVDAQQAFLDFSHEARRNLHEARIAGTDLREAHLEAAILSAARLDRAALIGAHLEGADLFVAHLEGTYINDAHFEGCEIPPEEAHQFQEWIGKRGEDYPGFGVTDTGALLKPADLRGVYFDNASSMWRANLGDTRSPRWCVTLLRVVLRKRATPNDTPFGAVRLADARWEGANVSVISWDNVQKLGDELDADSPVDSKGKPKTPEKRLADYEAAVRTYRQVATALQSQGSSEEASRYAYRAQKIQRKVLWRQPKYPSYFFSRMLDLLAGYGYHPLRTLGWYLMTLAFFAYAYFQVTHGLPLVPLGPLARGGWLRFGTTSSIPPLAWYEAIVLSVSSFHGRGFFQPVKSLGDPVAVLAAIEAVIGLLIEISFIATFTQRFFGKGSGS